MNSPLHAVRREGRQAFLTLFLSILSASAAYLVTRVNHNVFGELLFGVRSITSVAAQTLFSVLNDSN